MAKAPYNKPPLSIKDQVKLLKNRGLIIADEARAERYLSNISYYRLSAYFIPYEVSEYDVANRDHNFKPETTFDDILNLYIFDRKLKLLVMEAIERIEISVRSLWTYNLSSGKHAHCYMENSNFINPTEHLQNLNKLAQEITESSETHIKHYFEKYSEPFLPPIWAIVENLSFGTLSKWYKNTKDTSSKQQIARELGLPHIPSLEGTLQVLNLVRNICAHHGRLWNRRTVKRLPYIRRYNAQMQIEQTQSSDGSYQTQTSNNIYNVLIVLINMLRKINPDTTWPKRVAKHLLSVNIQHRTAIGCPRGFKKKEPWQIAQGVNP